MLALKSGAALVTGSVGLLSDAAESLVNVAAALALLWALRVASAPADYEHPYGHAKAEDLASAFEAALILLASAAIAWTAARRLLEPQPLENLPAGLAAAAIAGVLNAALAAWLGRAARRAGSPALAANSRHLWADVWTSVAVLGGVALTAVSGVPRLDPLLGLLVAAHIAREGTRVLRGALQALMDRRLPDAEEDAILRVLDRHPAVRGYHRLRTRGQGAARFAEVDVFVDPAMTVAAAHALVHALENEIHAELPNLTTTVHVEPHEPGRREGATVPREEYREEGEGA